jgi:hypothetical protein
MTVQDKHISINILVTAMAEKKLGHVKRIEMGHDRV